jgi:hypothetical protein
MSAFNRLTSNPRFVSVVIQDKKDIYPALKHFFGPQEARAAAMSV